MTQSKLPNDVHRLQPPKALTRWLYMLALVPTLTELLEMGSLPKHSRAFTTDVITTTLVLVTVTIVIRQSRRIANEIRTRIATNEQLQHANRLATVGQLAAGIAHELGSPLQVVAGRAKMVATGEEAGESAKESGQVILEQAQRMSHIIRGLLDFARRRPAQRSVTDMRDVAEAALRILGPIAQKKGVTLALDMDGSRSVQVDVVQIQQALTNLVMNAIQAVGASGHVTIATGQQEASPPSGHTALAGEYACIRVTDDGPGIAEGDLARVFEPFFTTKDVGEGTGLGLAVAYGLVHENGGWITVESELGRGACFSIFLPCHRQVERRP